MLHSRRQKYGFYPIFLLFLQVDRIKTQQVIKRQIKIFWRIILGIAIFLSAGALIIQLPQVQTYITGKVVRNLSEKLDGDIKFEKIHLRPFNTLILKNVSIIDRNPVTDPEDSTNVPVDTFFRAKYIIASFTYDGLFRQSGVHLKSAYIEDAQMNLVLENQEDDGTGDISTDNLSRIFRIKQPETPKRSEKEIFRIKDVEIKGMGFAMKSYMADRHIYSGGMDWNDLDVKDININAKDLAFKAGIMSGRLLHLSCTEKSGYVIEDMTGHAKVGRGKTIVEDLHIDDPWSDVHLPLFMMSYENIHAFQDFISLVSLDGKIAESELDFETISYFAPELKGNRFKAVVSGSMSGPVDDFTFSNIKVRSLSGGFSLTADGRMTGLPDINRTRLEARISNSAMTSAGVGNFISEWMMGKGKLDIGHIAEGTVFHVDASGSGMLNMLGIKASVISDIGAMQADVRLADMISRNRPIGIDGNVRTKDLDLGKIVSVDLLGPTTLNTTLHAKIGDGRQNTSVKIDSLLIDRLHANGYDYSHIKATGSLTKDAFNGNIICHDPNLNFLFNGVVALSSKTNNAKYSFYANLGHADLYALNIDKRGISRVNFQASADFTKTNRGDLRGKVDIGDLTFENRLGREDIGDITLISYNSDDMYTIRMESKFANGKYTGTAPVTTFISDLKDMTAKKEMPALFADSTYVWKGNRYDLNFRCSNSMNLLSFIMPGLYIDAGTELKASLDKEGTVKAELVSDRLAYGHNYLKGLKASFSNADDKLGGAVECDVIKLSSIVMNNSRMNLHANDNSIGLKYAYDNPGEEVNRGELLLHGKLSRNDDSVETQIDILPSSIYLNSKQWNFEKSSISIKPDNIEVPSFGLVSGEERISLSGKVSRERRDTLTLDLERFDISALNDLIKSDMRLKGHTSGKAQLISPLKEKGILADIICDSTYIADLPLGVLSIGSRWNEEEQNFGIYARNSLNGRNNLDFSGTLAPKGSILDGTVLLDMMEVGYVQPVVADIFSDIKGNVSGRIDLKGQLSNLEISSKDTYLNDGLLKIEYTNVPYHAEGPFHLDSSGAYFDNITIKDRYTGTGTVSGCINWDHFRNMSFDTSIKVNEIEGINLSEGEGEDFYGRVFGTGNVSITGPVSSLLLSVDAVTAKRGELHIPLTSAATGKVTNLLRFKEEEKEVEIDPYEEMMQKLKKKEKSDSDLTVRLRVNAQPDVEAFIEIDKATGNVLSGHGTGLIDIEAGTDKFLINGDYTLTGGNYRFVALGLVSRDFLIQDGSSIRFNGDIMQSTLDIGATYRTKASLATLLADVSSVSNKRNVDCAINITGRLSNPSLKFGIDIPDLNPMVKSRVESALSTEDKIQKQFLSLIVSNNFLPDEQSGIVNNTSALYSNVTEILANQLNNIFHKLDIPVDLGLNYQPNDKGNDLFDVAVSTQLFNNRVVVNGNIGNREYNPGGSQNDVVGDLDIEIKIDRSGSFRLNLFSHSADQFSNYLDNSQRNGVGIMYQTEFNSFRKFLRNMFMRKAKRQAAKLEEEQSMLQGGRKVLKIEADNNVKKKEDERQ